MSERKCAFRYDDGDLCGIMEGKHDFMLHHDFAPERTCTRCNRRPVTALYAVYCDSCEGELDAIERAVANLRTATRSNG